MTPPELSAAEWSTLKRVWFALESASAAEQVAALADHDLSPAVRHELGRMFEARHRFNARLDVPAHVVLGLGTTSGGVEHDTTGRRLDTTPTLVGRRIGAFRVVRLVGRGGMGAVYEAARADDAFRQRVAIKTIWRGADSDVLLQRFRSERQILAGLQHPNIAQLVDGGSTEEGTPWLAMEYVEGTPIDTWCDARRFGISARLALFRQVCAAVHHAHQRLVVHRDLKPSNILVVADGTVKLLDFGVAKLVESDERDGTLTAAGYSPFTAAYAAPEQALGTGVSTSTDVYSLGAVLTMLLAGAPPHDFTGADSSQRLETVRHGEPRLPSVVASDQPVAVAAARGFADARGLTAALRHELDAIAAMALRRDPARRYASAEALSDDLERYLRRDRVHARPDTAGYRLYAFARRNRAVTTSVITVCMSIVLAGALALAQAARIREEAARAERAASFLSGMVIGLNATGSEPVVRLTPQGTLAQLLDSALVRVPREFGKDDKTRAQLYTAIGANFASQGRAREARRVLDSARTLARVSYGPRSEAYARASLEYASLVLDTDGPVVAEEAIGAAEQALGRVARASDLPSRVKLLRAWQALPLGRVGRADSLASWVSAEEARLGRRSQLTLRAEALRMAASSWLTRDPRDYLRRARAVRALADSLGLSLSNDGLRAAAAEIEALLVLGRVDEAAVVVNAWQDGMRAVIGTTPAVTAHVAYMTAFAAAVQGDTAQRRQQITTAWSLVQASDELPLNVRLLVSNAAVDDALIRDDVAAARHIAGVTAQRLQPSGAPMILSFAELYLGQARLAAGDPVGAEAAFRAGLAWIADTPDLSSMGSRLRRPLADALTRQGRVAEAEEVRALDPPRGLMPPCTPGGDWRGCPDG
jgi:serine/threonine protein kinase